MSTSAILLLVICRTSSPQHARPLQASQPPPLSGHQGPSRNMRASFPPAGQTPAQLSRHQLSSRGILPALPHRVAVRAAPVGSQPSTTQATISPASQAAAEKYGWRFDTPVTQHDPSDTPSSTTTTTSSSSSASQPDRKGRLIKELPVAAIRRPLGRTRANDQDKVEALMASITDIGLQEPIDVLEVDGQFYGFSGCHRFEAHQRLGLESIRCRVRKATKEVLKMHMM